MPESPFKISVPETALARLHKKLDLVTLPDELKDAGWDYGVPLANVQRLLARWKDGYDWRHHEAQLNAAMPQFTRPISVDGHGTLSIHYVHQRSTVVDAIPLLFVHGWPGSFLEARKILPMLTAGSAEHPSFHVVAMSLPGFGFSEGPSTKGFDMAQYAEVGNKLMLALGYNEYVTQGGDWGYAITRNIALLYGEKHTKAWHTNSVIGRPPSSNPEADAAKLPLEEQAAVARATWFHTRGSGYLAEQSTQPQTLGYALADSPLGLLAWIYEKLVTWTDKYPWTDDEVLTWVSIFWFSRAGPAASIRIYFEAGNRDLRKAFGAAESKPTIPLGLSHFPQDILVSPKSWTRGMGNIVFDGEHDKGGHFAAYEQPKALVGDLRKMFGKEGPAFGAVPGKSGYA
ncbi:Alpha/Beta hydrolase protein [Mycena sp. CBHHK59/15]|nr:Alpha/Beta hydrolase protein [Mycena sp. CBHHK59/15]